MVYERKLGFFSFYIYIYIYIKGVFGNFILKRVGSGPDMTKTWTRPYYLSGQVKYDPLRSSRTGYPRVGLLLPSLREMQDISILGFLETT